MIKTKSYILPNSLITSELLIAYISKFWNYVFSPLILNGVDQHLMVLCKVAYNQPMFDANPAYKTLGNLRRVNHSDKELFQEYLIQRLGHLSDSYTTDSISNISFSYLTKEGLATDSDRRLLQDISDKSLASHRYNNMILPITMVPSEYGDIRLTNYIQVGGESIQRFMVINGNKSYEIDVSSDGFINKVTVLKLQMGEEQLLV